MPELESGKYYVSSTGETQGEWATKNEYYVSLALRFYKIPFKFHYEILGGSSVRGGFVIDFLIYNPFPMALEVFGNYWHEGSMAAEDKLKVDLLRSYFGYEPIIIWGNESETIEDAKQSVKRKVL